MALVLGIDTYVELEAATQYIADFGGGETLAEADLKRATLAMDRLYGGHFMGVKTNAAQPLEFPRDGDTDIPTALQHATIELAMLMVNGLDVYAQPDPLVTKESVVVDVIEKSVEYASPTATNKLHKVQLILRPLLVGTSAFLSVDVVRG